MQLQCFLLLLMVASSTLGFPLASAITMRKSLLHRGGNYPSPPSATEESNYVHISQQDHYRGVPIFQAQSASFSDNDSSPSKSEEPQENHNTQAHKDHNSANNYNNNKKLPFLSFQRLLNSTETFFRHFVLMLTTDPDLVKLFSNFFSYAFWVYLSLSILGTIGIDTKPFLSLVSITGITLGFAAKDILTNSFSGIFILFTRPFQRGSIISVSGFKGKVIAMDMRYVRLQSLTDKSETLVPLSIVYKSAITIERP